MDTAQAWRQSFAAWPEELPRRGILVTSYNEQIMFDSFLVNPEFMLIMRNAPDAMGARQLMIPYENITALKMIDVIEAKNWRGLGFATKPVAPAAAPAPARAAAPRPTPPA